MRFDGIGRFRCFLWSSLWVSDARADAHLVVFEARLALSAPGILEMPEFVAENCDAEFLWREHTERWPRWGCDLLDLVLFRRDTAVVRNSLYDRNEWETDTEAHNKVCAWKFVVVLRRFESFFNYVCDAS